MSIDRSIKLGLCEATLDDFYLQTYALQAEIEYIERREMKIRKLRDNSKTPLHLWILNQTLKSLADQAGRAHANLAVTDNNMAFFRARLEHLLEDTDD